MLLHIDTPTIQVETDPCPHLRGYLPLHGSRASCEPTEREASQLHLQGQRTILEPQRASQCQARAEAMGWDHM